MHGRVHRAEDQVAKDRRHCRRCVQLREETACPWIDTIRENRLDLRHQPILVVRLCRQRQLHTPLVLIHRLPWRDGRACLFPALYPRLNRVHHTRSKALKFGRCWLPVLRRIHRMHRDSLCLVPLAARHALVASKDQIGALR